MSEERFKAASNDLCTSNGTTSKGEARGYIQPGALKELWFHTGTNCNLSCPFCLEGSRPGENRLNKMTLGDVKPVGDGAIGLGG